MRGTELVLEKIDGATHGRHVHPMLASDCGEDVGFDKVDE